MSDILPISTVLPVVREDIPINQAFTANLTEVGAVLLSITVTALVTNDGIDVSGSSYSGEYKGVFTLNGGLKYRLKTGERLTANRWEDLPDPKLADLYSFEAPQSLEKDFQYSVEMIYEVSDPATPTIPPVRHKIEKIYTQTVVGSWSVWANNLRDYVSRGI